MRPLAVVAGGVGLAACAALVAGCFSPDVLEGQFSCTGEDTRCPDSLRCDPCTHLCVSAEQPCSADDMAGSQDQSVAGDMTSQSDLFGGAADMTCLDRTACNGKCGTLMNKCGTSVTCSGCQSGFTCTIANVCCETDATLCAQKSAVCGQITVIDNCGQQRTVNCGSCGGNTPKCNASNQCVQCLTDADCPSGTAPLCTASFQCGCGIANVVCNATSICTTYSQNGVCSGQPGTTCSGASECASLSCSNNLCDAMLSGQPCRTSNDCLNHTACQPGPLGCQ